jgi:hypothetical protein
MLEPGLHHGPSIRLCPDVCLTFLFARFFWSAR